jgi:hypothetical protein
MRTTRLFEAAGGISTAASARSSSRSAISAGSSAPGFADDDRAGRRRDLAAAIRFERVAGDGKLANRRSVDAANRPCYFVGTMMMIRVFTYRFGLLPQPLTACPRQRAETTRACRFRQQRDSRTE